MSIMKGAFAGLLVMGVLVGCSNRDAAGPEPKDLGKVVTEASRANAANTQRDIHNRVRPGNI
jgi:hypothetical protein